MFLGALYDLKLSPYVVVQDVPECLSSHWDAVCVTYVNNVKAVMQHLRSQRAEIDRGFYDIRYDLLHILYAHVAHGHRSAFFFKV